MYLSECFGFKIKFINIIPAYVLNGFLHLAVLFWTQLRFLLNQEEYLLPLRRPPPENNFENCIYFLDFCFVLLFRSRKNYKKFCINRKTSFTTITSSFSISSSDSSDSLSLAFFVPMVLPASLSLRGGVSELAVNHYISKLVLHINF